MLEQRRISTGCCVLTPLAVSSAESCRRVHDVPIMEPSDTLHNFRHSLYECLHPRNDALSELIDAILTADAAVPSPVHLSLQVSHRRGWGSLYAALDLGGSTPKLCGCCSPAIRSPEAKRPYTP